jgi:ADP-heptose:LPS heptosyltransferase
MTQQIIIRRSGALGDVILATPVVREMRRRHPEAEISIITGYPEVFKNSPHQVTAYPWLDPRLADIFVDLDLAYERRPKMHIVAAYMEEAFGPENDVRLSFYQQELNFSNETPYLVQNQSTPYWVAIHPAIAGWANRTLPKAFWREVCTLLYQHDFLPVMVGRPRDTYGIPNVVWHSTVELDEIAQLIDKTACFIGSDSALLHLAGCTKTPIVGIFTSADPRLRMPHRFGTLGLGCAAVMPALGCIFCHHRQTPPATTEHCERSAQEQNLCVQKVDPELVIEAVLQLTKDRRLTAASQ